MKIRFYMIPKGPWGWVPRFKKFWFGKIWDFSINRYCFSVDFRYNPWIDMLAGRPVSKKELKK